jgi:amino acid permease
MKLTQDRRSFLKMFSTSIGIGVLYTAMPSAAAVAGTEREFFMLDSTGRPIR